MNCCSDKTELTSTSKRHLHSIGDLLLLCHATEVGEHRCTTLGLRHWHLQQGLFWFCDNSQNQNEQNISCNYFIQQVKATVSIPTVYSGCGHASLRCRGSSSSAGLFLLPLPLLLHWYTQGLNKWTEDNPSWPQRKPQAPGAISNSNMKTNNNRHLRPKACTNCHSGLDTTEICLRGPALDLHWGQHQIQSRWHQVPSWFLPLRPEWAMRAARQPDWVLVGLWPGGIPSPPFHLKCLWMLWASLCSPPRENSGIAN